VTEKNPEPFVCDNCKRKVNLPPEVVLLAKAVSEAIRTQDTDEFFKLVIAFGVFKRRFKEFDD